MSNALAIAASGLRSEEFNLDKIANNLANLNTANYKATKLSFRDAISSLNTTEASSGVQKSSTPQFCLGAFIGNISKDFSQGPLKPSNNWQDLAIDGVGFFQVINKEGSLSYTRNSSLKIDDDRYLATQDGLRLADNIQIPEDFSEIVVQKNGEVEAFLSPNSAPQYLGTIKLAKFVNPEFLDSVGGGLYNSTEQSGEALMDSPGNNSLGLILQKQTEGSNVDMVDALMQLTLAERIYQLNSKAIQVIDELEKRTNEIPG